MKYEQKTMKITWDLMGNTYMAVKLIREWGLFHPFRRIHATIAIVYLLNEAFVQAKQRQ